MANEQKTGPTPEVVAVRQHLIAHLGKPTEVVQLGSGGVSKRIEKIEVATFAPGGKDAPVVTVSCGISQVPLGGNRAMEGMFIVRPANDPRIIPSAYGLFGALAAHVDAG